VSAKAIFGKLGTDFPSSIATKQKFKEGARRKNRDFCSRAVFTSLSEVNRLSFLFLPQFLSKKCFIIAGQLFQRKPTRVEHG